MDQQKGIPETETNIFLKKNFREINFLILLCKYKKFRQIDVFLFFYIPETEMNKNPKLQIS